MRFGVLNESFIISNELWQSYKLSMQELCLLDDQLIARGMEQSNYLQRAFIFFAVIIWRLGIEKKPQKRNKKKEDR